MQPRHRSSSRALSGRGPALPGPAIRGFTPRVCGALAGLALLASGCSGLVEVQAAGEPALPPPDQTSVVVAADGSVLAELHAEQDRELVPLDRIPDTLRDAVLAVEDARFYAHGGVDARAVARAFVENAQEGEVVQGGSTITQQLAKTVTGNDQTLDRKLSEASVALQLEQRYSKDDILERYLNVVALGHGVYGVQTAARRYFGVDVEEVTLPQAALLAGMIAAPATYDPVTAPRAAIARRDVVLDRMVTNDLVTPQEAAAAGAAPLGVVASPGGQLGAEAPWFVDHVLDELQHSPEFVALGPDPVERADFLFREGLRVETTLDPAWQAAAERAVAETLTDPDDPRAAVVAIDPGTGEVNALVGGRAYGDPDDPTARFNLAVDGRRQPGSAFKPLVLATALGQGHTLDERFPGGSEVTISASPGQPEWRVRNYEGADPGALSLADATRLSVNTVYARLTEEVGVEAVATTASAAGIRRPLEPLPSLALGAQEVTPLEMASVQATLAAGGLYRAPSVVRRVLDADGTVLYERGVPIAERVLDEAVAWLTTTALEGVVEDGTGVRADLRRPTAGKTGTTQDGADAWFVGYTPDLAAAVWIGFPEGRVPMEPPRTRARVEGGTWPAELFARFGLRALADVPAADFPIPSASLSRVRVDVTRDCLPNPYTPPEVVVERGYLAGTEPTEPCEEPTSPPTVDVPRVVGLPVAAAARTLEDAGFTVSEREEQSATLPPGYVVAQVPGAGGAQTLEDGYLAEVVVSAGGIAAGPAVTVPDVLNLPLAQAQERLRAAGLVAEVHQRCPDGTLTCTGGQARPGRVWEQRPDAGQDARDGGTVRLSAYPST